jgi:hypothetical protein
VAQEEPVAPALQEAPAVRAASGEPATSRALVARVAAEALGAAEAPMVPEALVVPAGPRTRAIPGTAVKAAAAPREPSAEAVAPVALLPGLAALADLVAAAVPALRVLLADRQGPEDRAAQVVRVVPATAASWPIGDRLLRPALRSAAAAFAASLRLAGLSSIEPAHPISTTATANAECCLRRR